MATRMLDPRLPQIPNSKVLGLARIPSPPPPNPEWDDRRLGMEALAAYKAAFKRARGRDGWVPGGSKNRAFKGVVEAARALAEHEISLFGWAAWSWGVWDEYEIGKQKDPHLAWVFSAKRVADHHGWYNRDGFRIPPKVLYTPEARELMEAHSALMYELRHVPVDDDQTIAKLVQQMLPPEKYDRLLKRARAAGLRQQEDVDRAISNGVFLWD
jgi:hypothetical protein